MRTPAGCCGNEGGGHGEGVASGKDSGHCQVQAPPKDFGILSNVKAPFCAKETSLQVETG